ncbi:MAG: cyclic nucleotide-binding protein [Candidatus Parabeggiatoa sp. nov. 1]|nr:MAG: cyclic nucleotide-binding protein [Gammaproteobacteria bacterium]
MSIDNRLAKPFFCLSSTSSNNPNPDIFEVSRTFQLQKGEKLSLKRTGGEDYLYIASGKVTITDHFGGGYVLDARQPPAARTFIMPKNFHLLKVTAEANSIFYHVDSEKLDYLVFWKELTRTMAEKGGHLTQWMDKLRNLSALRRLPAESVCEAIRRMKLIEVNAGEEIVREDEPGDAFYLIESGQAEVWQTGFYDDEPKKIAELGEGEMFGEDALVTGGTRNATVKMIEKGQLLVLNQSDFLELVSKPMIREVEAGVAKAMMAYGYQMLDVRCEEEYAVLHIPGAILLPLHQLRQRLSELDHNLRYVTYCRSGKRAAVAAFLLNQRQFEVVSMKGGLLNWPFELKCWHLPDSTEPHTHCYPANRRLLKFLSILGLTH